MLHLPRIAVGTVQQDARIQPMLWALLDVLERQGTHVQAFFSQARFVARNGAMSITGQSHRHLDSWLMTRDVCREIFWHGTRSCDLSLVGGQYDAARPQPPRGGSLDTLCDWLDLPRIVVLDASRLDGCAVPPRPEKVDGLLLDCVQSRAEAGRLAVNLEALWGVPVLGALETLAPLRAIINEIPAGGAPSRRLCHSLSNRLIRGLKLKTLMRVAEQRAFGDVEKRLFDQTTCEGRLNVAVAYDDAFTCYFPDTLDLLEAHGATIRDFSPLRGDSLPPDTDLVYLGCGHAERYAETLAGNYCMKQALINHVGQGRRIYAEGSGLAYLCQDMVLDADRQLPMVGVLPAHAQLNPHAGPLEPVEVTLSEDCWLGEASARLRGYLNSNWLIEPLEPLNCFASELRHRADLVGYRHVVGSRLHLNFAAQPQFLRSFFQPHSSSVSSLI